MICNNIFNWQNSQLSVKEEDIGKEGQRSGEKKRRRKEGKRERTKEGKEGEKVHT